MSTDGQALIPPSLSFQAAMTCWIASQVFPAIHDSVNQRFAITCWAWKFLSFFLSFWKPTYFAACFANFFWPELERSHRYHHLYGNHGATVMLYFIVQQELLKFLAAWSEAGVKCTHNVIKIEPGFVHSWQTKRRYFSYLRRLYWHKASRLK